MIVLQGIADSFTLQVSGGSQVINRTLGATTTSTLLEDLIPNTDYTFILTVYTYGGLSKSTDPVIGRTADGGRKIKCLRCTSNPLTSKSIYCATYFIKAFSVELFFAYPGFTYAGPPKILVICSDMIIIN